MATLRELVDRLEQAIARWAADLGNADTLELDPKRTRRQSELERDAQIALDARLADKPTWCQFCHGPLDFINGQAVCIHARLGRCPPPKKERP